MAYKIFFITILLINIMSSCFAEKREWIDKNYDFSSSSKIYVIFNIPDNIKDGITEHETNDLFIKKLNKQVTEQLLDTKYRVKTLSNVLTDIKRFNNIDLIQMYQANPAGAETYFQQYLLDNFDAILVANLLVYDTGTQYQEGYFYNMPTTNSTYVTTPYGTSTVTTNTMTQQYVPGGNYPVAYAAVKFEIKDIKTGKVIWTRIDDRARMNKTIFDNTKPFDLYGRILGSYFNDLTDTLKDSITKDK